MDALAAKGVRFTHATIGKWCMPSRAAVLTGVMTMQMEGDFEWLVHSDQVRKARNLVDRLSDALSLLSDEAEPTDDSLEYHKVLLPNTPMDASLYEQVARFERHISKVEPNA